MISERQVDIDQANILFSSITGEYVWLVRCVEDSILRLEFGEPHLVVQDPRNVNSAINAVVRALGRRIVMPAGRWSLFVQDGMWNVEVDGLQCSRSDSDQSKIDLCLSMLSGQKLVSTIVSTELYSLSMNFDRFGKLRITRNVDFDDNDQWMLFMENNSILSYTSNDSLVIEEDKT